MRKIRDVEYIEETIPSEKTAPNLTDSRQMAIRYTVEGAEDERLSEIKDFCLRCVARIPVEADYSLDDISEMQDFVNEKFEEVSELKDRLKLPQHYGPVKSVSYNLDMATLSGSLDHPSKETYRVSLSRETEALSENLAMLSAVLDQVIEDIVRISLEELGTETPVEA